MLVEVNGPEMRLADTQPTRPPYRSRAIFSRNARERSAQYHRRTEAILISQTDVAPKAAIAPSMNQERMPK